MIFNVAKITEKLGKANHYSYTRIKNMMRGMEGNSKKKDVQEVRRILKKEWQETDQILAALENKIDSKK